MAMQYVKTERKSTDFTLSRFFNSRKRAISAFLSAMQRALPSLTGDAQALLFMKVKGKQ
jgi:hypothetical protein